MFDMINDFSRVADRWYSLIFKGALAYSIPGRLDPEDLVQEGLILLHETITSMVIEQERWEVDSFEFEKYFKSSLYHRFVDKQRVHQSKKRNYRNEVHESDEHNPLEHIHDRQDNPESIAIGSQLHDRLRDRVPEKYHNVLNAWLDPSSILLNRMRKKTLRCLNRGSLKDCRIEYETSGTETTCANCGSPTVVVRSSSPSRILQSDIQESLGITRSALSEAMFLIRQSLKNLNNPDFDVDITPFLEMFGYGRVMYESGVDLLQPPPMIASCRFEDGTPTYKELTYSSLSLILSDDEKRFLDYIVMHKSEYYQTLRFSDLAKRMGITVHDVRRTSDVLRIKLELIASGVPLKDIPKGL